MFRLEVRAVASDGSPGSLPYTKVGHICPTDPFVMCDEGVRPGSGQYVSGRRMEQNARIEILAMVHMV